MAFKSMFSTGVKKFLFGAGLGAIASTVLGFVALGSQTGILSLFSNQKHCNEMISMTARTPNVFRRINNKTYFFRKNRRKAVPKTPNSVKTHGFLGKC